jgi:hypothetical protein
MALSTLSRDKIYPPDVKLVIREGTLEANLNILGMFGSAVPKQLVVHNIQYYYLWYWHVWQQHSDYIS